MEEQKTSKKSVKRADKSLSPAAEKKTTAKGSKTKDLTGSHPAPKRACSPWIFWNTEISAKFREQGKQKEAFTLSSEAWQKASEEEKAPYVKQAAADQQRVVKQTEELKRKGFYTLADGSKSTDEKNKALFKVKAKKGKEEEKEWQHPPPKRAMTAWTYFNSESYKKYYDQGKGKEAFSLASEAWKACTEEQKAPYALLAVKDKAREGKQATELAKLGYYTLPDGTKSTDPENAKLLKVKKKRSTLNRSKSSASSDGGELDVRSAPATKGGKPKAGAKGAKAEAKPGKKPSAATKVTEPAKETRARSPARGKAPPKQQEAPASSRGRSLPKQR